jgi:hypothetical protein
MNIMTTFVVKPYINNNNESKEFDNVKAALQYLNSFLPDDYPVLAFEDAILIGKLFAKDGTDIMPKKRPPGRPKKVRV